MAATIRASDLMHPQDKAALTNLEAVPLLPQAVRGFMRLGFERLLHGTNMANKVRLGPKQLPAVYRVLPPICEAFGIDEPEFYLEMNPMPNAYTYGDKLTFVTVTSGLVEMMEDEELQAVVAHECGHIVCHHVLYHTMADLVLKFGVAIFGPLAAVAAPLQLALLYWSRRSELSADRAAAVFMGSCDPVVETMLRLAGGPKSLTGTLDRKLFMEQAKAYDELLERQWDELLQKYAAMGVSHPFLAVRVNEIVRWSDTEDWPRLIGQIDKIRDALRCPHCGVTYNVEWRFCRRCGEPRSSQRPRKGSHEQTMVRS